MLPVCDPNATDCGGPRPFVLGGDRSSFSVPLRCATRNVPQGGNLHLVLFAAAGRLPFLGRFFAFTGCGICRGSLRVMPKNSASLSAVVSRRISRCPSGSSTRNRLDAGLRPQRSWPPYNEWLSSTAPSGRRNLAEFEDSERSEQVSAYDGLGTRSSMGVPSASANARSTVLVASRSSASIRQRAD